jgi:ATP-dependent Clp protease ATP-binding subunit ClpA
VKAGGLRSRTRKRRHLVRVGYDPRYGARPLKRAIQKQIETPLAKSLVAGEIRNGEGVYVDVDENGALKFVPGGGAGEMTSKKDQEIT